MVRISLIFFLLFATFYAVLAQSLKCTNGTIWTPLPGTSWFWDLSDGISTQTVDDHPVQVYDFDMFNLDPAVIDYIHQLNRTVICYIDTAYEPYRPDSDQFPKSVLGHSMKGWPGQKWVDIRSDAVKEIMANRLLMAYNKGCDAIEWDDVDSYENNPGFGLRAHDQLNFNTYLAQITHAMNMSAGLKNDVDQTDTLVTYFDWALDEQCYQYSECDTLEVFIQNNKAVFGAEYKGDAKKICPSLNNRDFSWIFTDLDLDGKVTECCQYESPPCVPVEYTCMPPPDFYPVFAMASNLHSSLMSVVFFCFISSLVYFLL